MVFLAIGVVPIVVATLRITLSAASAEASPTAVTGGRAAAAA